VKARVCGRQLRGLVQLRVGFRPPPGIAVRGGAEHPLHDIARNAAGVVVAEDRGTGGDKAVQRILFHSGFERRARFGEPARGRQLRRLVVVINAVGADVAAR
jgi:hypothetical protein